jgi:hypothetical protein
MQSRTPLIRDHHMKFWTEVQDQMERLEHHMKTATPEERMRRASVSLPPADKHRSMTLDDVRRITASPMEHTLGPYIAAQLPYIMLMRCIVLCTTSDPGFITSDAPVVSFDPNWHKKPPIHRSPSLSDPQLEITMPVSPSQMLMIGHQNPGRRQTGIQYVEISEDEVEELNRRTRFGCDKEFVVRREVKHPRWFERGTMPPDAWEALHGMGEST